jgi:chromosome segregation ATPase
MNATIDDSLRDRITILEQTILVLRQRTEALSTLIVLLQGVNESQSTQLSRLKEQYAIVEKGSRDALETWTRDQLQIDSLKAHNARSDEIPRRLESEISALSGDISSLESLIRSSAGGL